MPVDWSNYSEPVNWDDYGPPQPEETIGPSDTGIFQRLRNTEVARRLLGPTQIEREGMIGGGGSQTGVIEIPEAMLKAVTPSELPGVSKAYEYSQKINPLTYLPDVIKATGQGEIPQRIAAIPAGVESGIGTAALGFPIAPIPGASIPKVGAAVLATFGAQYLASQPEQYAAFKAALARGDYGEATKILTSDVAGGAALGLGAAHTAKTIREGAKILPNAAREAAQTILSEPVKQPEVTTETKTEAAPIEAPAEAQPIQEGVPNALVTETAQPIRPVREEPIESVQQVPAESPSGEINEGRGEAQRVQGTEAAPSQISLAPPNKPFLGKIGEWESDQTYSAAGKIVTIAKNKAGLEYIWDEQGNGWVPYNQEAFNAKYPPEATPAQVPLTYGDKYIKENGIEAAKDRIKYLSTKFDEAVSSGQLKSAENLSEESQNISRALSKIQPEIPLEQKPVEPVPPPEPRSPIELLNQSAAIKVTAPEGATMVRVTDSNGKTSVQPLKSVNKGSNPFQNADIAKIEAGTIGKDKKFNPIEGSVGVEDRSGPPEGIQWLHAGIPIPINLRQAWEGLKTAWRTSPNKQRMAAHRDAADNAARTFGIQMGNRVKLWAPDAKDRAALTFVIEAADNPQNLVDMLAKVSGKNKKYTEAINRAMTDWDRLKPIANKIADLHEEQRLTENANGVDTDYLEGYAKHAYDNDMLMGKGRPVLLTGRGGIGQSLGFKKQRSFPTYADAIQNDYVPSTLDIAKLVDSRVTAGTKLINRIQWGNELRGVTDPTSGKPIVTSLIKQPKGTEVPPPGYEFNEIIPGMRVAVHEGYGRMFDALNGGSKVAELELKGIPVGELALKGTGNLKHLLLMFDTFHASRILQKALFLTGKPRYARGTSLLDYSDADLASAVSQKLITQKMADYAKANRPVANLLIKEGLNVGRVQEALYSSLIREIPVMGTFNKWVFEKVTRGAMLEAGIIEFDRVQKQNPTMSPTQVAAKVSGDLNTYFGNLGRQGIFKSKTWQDMARLVFLAPQWVESMVTTEAKGYGQILKAPIDSARARQLQIGTLAKGVGQGLAAYFLGTQLLNLATTKGKFTWQNDDKRHKLDAWIPDITGKTPGFYISPFSVVADVTHDFLRYTKADESRLEAAAHIARNKFSQPWRAASILFTGRDFADRKIFDDADKIQQAAVALSPTPIPIKPLTEGSAKPGQMQRQLTASLGFKTEPKLSPEMEKAIHFSKLNEYTDSLRSKAKQQPLGQRYRFIKAALQKRGYSPRDVSHAMDRLERTGLFEYR